MIIDLCVIHAQAPPVVAVSGQLAFTASLDHATVTSYEARVRPEGSGTIVATQNLGKPAPDVDNRILVNIAATLAPLASGNYTVAVAAISPSGTTESLDTSAYSLPLA